MGKIEINYGEDKVNVKRIDNHVKKIVHKMFRCSGEESYLMANTSLRIEMLTDIAEVYCDIHALWNADRRYVASKLWLFTVLLTCAEEAKELN